MVNFNLIICLLCLRDFRGALTHSLQAIKLDPNSLLLRSAVAMSCFMNGRFQEAIEFSEPEAASPEGSLWWALIALAGAYVQTGTGVKAQELLQNLRHRSALGQPVSPLCFAGVHMALGEVNETFAHLEKAYADRHRDLVWIKSSGLWDPLRSDPRFRDLIARMSLSA